MRTIAVTEDRSSPTATSRRRSALEEASMDGAVLMSFLTVLGLAGDAWVDGSLSDLPARRAAAVAWRGTHSLHSP